MPVWYPVAASGRIQSLRRAHKMRGYGRYHTHAPLAPSVSACAANRPASLSDQSGRNINHL